MRVKFGNESAVGVEIITEEQVWDLWEAELATVGEEFLSEVRVFEDRLEADILILRIVDYDGFKVRNIKKERKFFDWNDLFLMNRTLATILKGNSSKCCVV